MTAMAILLGVLFIGITIVAHAYQILPTVGDIPTTVSLVAGSVFGNGSILFVLFQASTALILFLAANTSYNAFPRLGAILAIDGYMPRQFSYRGDRLAYSWGIILLSAVAAFLHLAVRRRGHRPDPALLGRRVRLLHPQPDRDGQALADGHASRAGSGGSRSTPSGRVLTAVVLVVVVSVKFVDGAYLVVILIPTLVAMMLFIHRQYDASRRELAGPPGPRLRAAASRGAGRRADPGHQPGRHPGGQRRPLGRRRRPGGLHHRERPRTASASASAGSARCRACRSSSSSRRTGR